MPVSKRLRKALDEDGRPDDEGCAERGRDARGERSSGATFSGATVTSGSAKVVGCSVALTGVPHVEQKRAVSASGW
jgi:hypothetical protein